MVRPFARRRWPLVVAVAALLVVAVVAVVTRWPRTDDAAGRPAWTPPPQAFLASSMDVQPVPGWRANVVDFGVPGSVPGAPATGRVTTNADPAESSPFIGNLGNFAYFLSGAPSGPESPWWLVGIDVRDGERLFPPVRLDAGSRAPSCFTNGPDALMCLTRGAENVTAWVIDAHTGTVTHTGPTDLRTAPPVLMVHQVGIYAIAETQHQGIYGIGTTAETTWFVPGDGSVDQEYLGPRDAAPPTLITQSAPSVGPDAKVVIALRDGHVVSPDVGDDAQEQQTAVYPGGFAAVIERNGSQREVEFFDDAGKKVGGQGVRGLLDTGGGDLPMVSLTSGGWAAYTPTGGKLLDAPGNAPGRTRLIGTSLFVEPSEGSADGWLQYDLRSGTKVSACEHGLDAGYVAVSGGRVAILSSGNPNVGLTTRGVDLASCATLWSIESPPGSFRDVWRINTTLVQLSDDGTELMSLVAPG